MADSFGFSPHFSVRRERRGSSVGENPTRQLTLQPVAIGAAVEEMKPLKPLMERVTLVIRRACRSQRE